MKKLSISIHLQEIYGIDRNREPVRIGVPLPRGVVSDPEVLELVDAEGNVIPLQAKTISKWPDRSAKWVLLDFQASIGADSKKTFQLLSTNTSSTFSEKVEVQVEKNEISVNTGRCLFSISSRSTSIIEAVKIGGQNVLAGPVQALLSDYKGRECLQVIEKVNVDEKGPLRASISAEGYFKEASGKIFIRFISTASFFAGKSLVQIEFRIHNPRAAFHPGGLWDLGDPASVQFRDLTIRLPLLCTSHPSIKSMINEDSVPYRSLERLSLVDVALKSKIVPHRMILSIYQDSSGGKNWNSTNHIDRQSKSTVSFRGYRITSQHNSKHHILKEGLRANPVFLIETGITRVSATVDKFWKNFPKALRSAYSLSSSEAIKLGAKERNCDLDVALFPSESHAGYELQGGEKKTHLVFIEFDSESGSASLQGVLRPLHVWTDPISIQESQAVPFFAAASEKIDSLSESYIRNVIEGPNSFFMKREVVDEFGWRNFGDIYADHEAMMHKGETPLVSHYNNQYDFIYGGLVNYLRTGDQRWRELAMDLALHVIDVDIYHTDEDKPAYNNGLFWHTDHYLDAGTATHRSYTRKSLNFNKTYGGGPSNENNYTSGLLLFYYLTGNLSAYDAVIALSDWVLKMDDGLQSILALIDERPTGLASQTASTAYHGPGRGSGNSINALCDGYRLSGKRIYMSKAEELIARCIHPNDDIEKLELVDDPEMRWSYLVFLQSLGKYLDLKIELQEMDFNFFYARDSLLHYAEWMTEKEKPYQEVLDKVMIPTETWPAHDIRKAHVLFQAGCLCRSKDHQRYFERAEYFFTNCLQHLLSWKTAYLTRPLVIISVYSSVRDYFIKDIQHKFLEHNYHFGQKVNFLSQREMFVDRIGEKLRNTLRHLKLFLRSMMYRVKT